MNKWVCERLSALLNFPVPKELPERILEIQNEKELDEFLQSLLNFNSPKHKQFVAELKKRQAVNKDYIGYKKPNDKDNVVCKKQNEKKKGKSKIKENIQPQEPPKPEKVEKKKTKFVNLYSQEGHNRAAILLKGRHKCNCEAKTHELVNNCLHCGRIVCSQEGAGPCFFCGELVCSPEQQSILSSNTKHADHLYNKLMCQKPSKNFEDSIKQRDKLLEYDRNSTRCTKVIDDESDYYRSDNIWLSAKEREKLQKHEEEFSARKHASRLDRKITFDFAGRQIVEEDNYIPDLTEEQLKDLCKSIPFDDIESINICRDIEYERPTYIELNDGEPRSTGVNIPRNVISKIQDKEYLEMSDQGLCLSMHQPHASLLVAGIKTHEGRTWYTSHRGRLWIASASRSPTMEEISTAQQFYRLLNNQKIRFPESYPTGCLLGCVTVTDVLPQEEYRKVYPEGESDSPYVFICESSYVLPIKFPIQGKHKIYKLEQKIHQAALKSLEKLMKNANN